MMVRGFAEDLIAFTNVFQLRDNKFQYFISPLIPHTSKFAKALTIFYVRTLKCIVFRKRIILKVLKNPSSLIYDDALKPVGNSVFYHAFLLLINIIVSWTNSCQILAH